MRVMTSNRPKARADLALRGLVAVLATIVGLLLAACGDEGPATNAGVRIPVEWADARKVRSHETHVGKRKIECSKCHELDQGVLGPVPQERCAECHQGEAEIVHGAENARKLHGPTAGASCLDCHAFSQKPELDPKAAPGAWDCQRCHSEHPEGDVPAVVVHRSQACQTCHQPHAKPPVEQTSCPTCHSGVNATHATEGKSPEQVCTTCHASQHAPGKAANLSCAGCHAEQKPIVPATALFAEGHEKCTGCHRPHDFRPENVVSCRSCHEDRPVLGGGRIAAHAQCNSCHRPHDVKADPSGACVACHGAGKTDHPRAKGKASACTSCHDPHPGNAAAARPRPCSSCHTDAAGDKGFHAKTVPCVGCHTPHQFGLAKDNTATCARCHGQEVTLAAQSKGHRKCGECHAGLPHKPFAVQTCKTCHERQAAQVNRGHAGCQRCHDPHSAGVQKRCDSCHAKEHQSAPSGHKQCSTCHEPHTGQTTPGGCARCHQAAEKTPHARVDGGCAKCHRAHGPGGVAKPPSCTACHQTNTLAGLHLDPNHRECIKCHTGHGDQRPERAACAACHTNLQKHHPEANRCSGCHLFKAGD
mgnify:CR=1 FL=1